MVNEPAQKVQKKTIEQRLREAKLLEADIAAQPLVVLPFEDPELAVDDQEDDKSKR